jgi:hypothetical protein
MTETTMTPKAAGHYVDYANDVLAKLTDAQRTLAVAVEG